MKRLFTGFKQDATRITRHHTAFRYRTIIDTLAECDETIAAEHHRDGTQLVPRSPHGFANLQYAAALLHDVLIDRCTYYSAGMLQPIFASDGLFSDIAVTNCVMQTKGDHYISINGLLNGYFENNVNEHGEPVPIRLDNLRIGGGYKGGLWVLSMTDYEYEPVSADNLHDCRGEARRKGVTYIKDLDLDIFRYEMMQVKPADGRSIAKIAHDKACRLGNLVKT